MPFSIGFTQWSESIQMFHCISNIESFRYDDQQMQQVELSWRSLWDHDRYLLPRDLGEQFPLIDLVCGTSVPLSPQFPVNISILYLSTSPLSSRRVHLIFLFMVSSHRLHLSCRWVYARPSLLLIALSLGYKRCWNADTISTQCSKCCFHGVKC